jgi:lysyl endopeptidase
MRRLLFTSLASMLFAASFAQQGDGGTPKGFKFGVDIRDMDSYTLPTPDVDALRAEDELNDKAGNGPWRFGYNHSTSYTLNNSGTWTNLPDGGKIWQLKVTTEGALSINLTFKNLSITDGNELYVYDKDKKFVLGKFTDYHTYEGQLGCELIPGNTAIVEYYVSATNLSNVGSLELSTVTHGYRTNKEFLEKAFGTSGNCNMNVNCPDGAPWANQKRGAVMLVSGSNGFCSGSLINNTQNDGKPYVLTANHCYSNPASWIFRFHWESAACTNPGSSPSFVSLSGAMLRSRRTPSDFCLVEITGGLVGGNIPASYNAYFSGWNNSNTPPTSSISIHHPDGDIKKISFDDDPAIAVQAMGSSEAASCWQVSWDRNTTTEGGSSGSPLFDQNGRIIGQLWGGGASCSNLSSSDYYGRVYNSWNPSGSNSTNQLKNWLDPNNTGVTTIDGYDPNAVIYALDAQLLAVSSPTAGTTCNTSFTPQVTIKNNGTTTLTQVSVKYRIDNGVDVNYNWTGSLVTGATTNVALTSFTATPGNHIFKTFVSAPNAGTDQNNVNDTSVVLFEVLNPNGVGLPLSESFESATFPPTNWAIENAAGPTWTRVTTAASQGNASARKDNLNVDDNGQVDNLLTPYLSFNGQNAVTLTFKVAYARYNNTYSDSLIVWSTSNCGITWNWVYNKGGSALATAPNQTAAFVPTAAQWRLETVDLTPLAGQSNIRLMFQNKSGYGQILYIDEINIMSGASLPSPNFSVSDNTPCVNQSVALTNSSTGATSYVWNMPGAIPSTSTSTNPTVTYATAGNYTVTLTATNGNGSQTTQQNIVVSSCNASINEKEAFSINVFPNPASDVINIYTDIIGSDIHIKITDLSGKIVQNEMTVSAAQFSIDVSHFAQGIYLLTLQNEKGTIIHKIVKR